MQRWLWVRELLTKSGHATRLQLPITTMEVSASLFRIPAEGGAVKIYGVDQYTDEICVREACLSKTGTSYRCLRGHPGYGYRCRIRDSEACFSREDAVEAWRVMLRSKIAQLNAERDELQERLERGCRDEIEP